MATLKGWWNGRVTTPLASLICRVRSAAAAISVSGAPIEGHASEWCSPNQASS